MKKMIKLMAVLFAVFAGFTGCESSGSSSDTYTMPTGRDVMLQQVVLDHLLADAAYNRVMETVDQLRTGIESSATAQQVMLGEIDVKILAASTAQHIATDASFYLAETVNAALVPITGELQKKVVHITDLDQIEKYYRDTEKNGKFNTWANTEEEARYAGEYETYVPQLSGNIAGFCKPLCGRKDRENSRSACQG